MNPIPEGFNPIQSIQKGLSFAGKKIKELINFAMEKLSNAPIERPRGQTNTTESQFLTLIKGIDPKTGDFKSVADALTLFKDCVGAMSKDEIDENKNILREKVNKIDDASNGIDAMKLAGTMSRTIENLKDFYCRD